MTEIPQSCGSVAIVGAPNAGKSTLVNALVGQKVAIVSAKVQTTRTRLIGIATEGAAQLLLRHGTQDQPDHHRGNRIAMDPHQIAHHTKDDQHPQFNG